LSARTLVAEDERRRYVAELPHVLDAGGRFLMLGFATNRSDRGPRGYTPEELRGYLAGFREVFIRPAAYEVRPGMPLRDEALGDTRSTGQAAGRVGRP